MSGPHHIIKIKDEANIEVLLKHKSKKLVVYINRLKLYFVAAKNTPASPNTFPTTQCALNLPTPSHMLNSPAKDVLEDLHAVKFLPTVPLQPL